MFARRNIQLEVTPYASFEALYTAIRAGAVDIGTGGLASVVDLHGIEAACDAISREFHIEIQLAKDCGSLAVLISIVIATGIWGIALIERIIGAPI